MALSLTATQKSLRALFINDDRYIIPTFQRPYSWTRKEILQLYEDVTDAFMRGTEYFLGNVVIAKSDLEESHPNLIDGQQRILTLWVIVKILHVLTANSKLAKMLKIEDENDQPVSKIESTVYESADQKAINSLMNWTEEDFKVSTRAMKQLPPLQYNAVVAYKLFNEYFGRIEKEQQESFISYFINKVSLLPIELEGTDLEQATSRALTIFETINNRGLDLADSDILKAKIYEMARTVKEHHEFETEWERFCNKCREGDASVNDAFRYYLRILRAYDGQTTSEPNMRNFFLTSSGSPFKIRTWRVIMRELMDIGESLSYINDMRFSSPKAALLLEALKSFPSAYPFSALVVYLYKNMDQDDSQKMGGAQDFLLHLVADCYRYNPAQDIKYRIFEISSAIVAGREWRSKPSDLPEDFFENRKRMRKGMVLIYHYLAETNWAGENKRTEFKVDRLMQRRDITSLSDWPADKIEDALDDLGNFSITIGPYAKNLRDRIRQFKNSSLSSLHKIFNDSDTYKYHDFMERSREMKSCLTDFFLHK